MAQGPNAQSQIAQSITNFKANPDQLLTQFPNGGAELTSRARDLAVNDPSLLDPIVALLAKASNDQKSAVATGLGQARLITFRSNRTYSDQIAEAIAKTKDLDVVAFFAAATGDSSTAAAGAAGAGSAGASGGQTSGLGGAGGPGGSSLEEINGNSVNTANFSFTSSVSSSGSTTTGTVGGTTIISTVTP